jgi:2,3-bisphosphoglycerate-independent phosphoglycerate mutase
MRLLPFILIIALAVIPLNASAHGAVILIIDGFGSSYIAPHSATYVGGAPMQPIDLNFIGGADAAYELKVPVPATEYGHAVIVTGYSNASQEMVSYYHATIFDALKDDGYLALGILENGDSKEILGELDVAVREKNDSIYNPCFEYVQNGNSVPFGLSRAMKEYPRLPPSKAGKDPYTAYIKYNAWALGFARYMVTYMNESQPCKDYVLMINVGGLDSVGQNTGYEGYGAVLSGMDEDVGTLIDVCEASGTILMITGDHGMSFKEDNNRGSHSAIDVASRKESLMAPLLIYSDKSTKGSGIYGQECLAPTLLALLDQPNTMSLSDGEPLPVKEKPTLYLASKDLKSVTITGPDFNGTSSFTGLYRIKGLEKGDYIVSYNGTQRAVHLDHDELVDLREDEQDPHIVPPWMVYLAAAGISVAGMGIALMLAWMRR